jgi:hypothetical protein
MTGASESLCSEICSPPSRQSSRKARGAAGLPIKMTASHGDLATRDLGTASHSALLVRDSRRLVPFVDRQGDQGVGLPRARGGGDPTRIVTPPTLPSVVSQMLSSKSGAGFHARVMCRRRARRAASQPALVSASRLADPTNCVVCPAAGNSLA